MSGPQLAQETPALPSWVVATYLPRADSRSKQVASQAKLPDPPGFTKPAASLSSSKKARSSHHSGDASSSSSSAQAGTSSAAPRKPPSQEETDTLRLKQAWNMAIAPAKQLPMSAVGMYMTGNSLQIFSIMMVFMTFKAPLVALAGIGSAFARLETPGTRDRLVLVKLVYILTNLLAVGLGVWKVGKMGLLPTTRSDWLAWEAEREPLERAYPALGFGRWKT